mgnify:CR=1 FL=1
MLVADLILLFIAGGHHLDDLNSTDAHVPLLATEHFSESDTSQQFIAVSYDVPEFSAAFPFVANRYVRCGSLVRCINIGIFTCACGLVFSPAQLAEAQLASALETHQQRLVRAKIAIIQTNRWTSALTLFGLLSFSSIAGTSLSLLQCVEVNGLAGGNIVHVLPNR